MNQQELKDIAYDTLFKIASPICVIGGTTFNMRSAVMDMINGTETLLETDCIPQITIQNQLNRTCEYEVLNTTSVNAALLMNFQNKSDRIGLLNFASATKAGGGWLNGKIAQEEDIMRKTTAFPSLITANKFYDAHTKDNPFYTDAIIYSPNVFIIKNDNFDEVLPVKFDLYTCAAVNYKEAINNPILLQNMDNYKKQYNANLIYSLMYQRIKRIIQYMVLKKCDIPILGAFGCGVFGNNPEMVAFFFYHVLVKEGYDNYFKKVIFAVLDNSPNEEIYNIFLKQFII